jgi:hypothetical protein
MKERPIPFKGRLVRRILANAKTQTRRLMKPQPTKNAIKLFHTSTIKKTGLPEFTARDPRGQAVAVFPVDEHSVIAEVVCPYGAPGDRLWVREAFTWITGNGIRPWYRADGEPTGRDGKVLPTDPGCRRWMPSIHMPRKVCRIVLEVTGVRAERLQSITDADAIAEGVHELPLQEGQPGAWWTADVSAGPELHARTPRDAFRKIWDEVNGPGSWDADPWLWVVEFKRIDQAARSEAA